MQIKCVNKRSIEVQILPNFEGGQRSLFAFGLTLIPNDPRSSYLAEKGGRVFRLILHTENQQCHYQRDTTANGHTQPPFNITLCNTKCTVELVVMHRSVYFYMLLILCLDVVLNHSITDMTNIQIFISYNAFVSIAHYNHHMLYV